LDVEGVRAGIDYEPAESTTAMFGGNSNWRGPVWFPLNYLVATALERVHEFFGDEFTIEYPTGSGNKVTLDVVAADFWERLVAIFLADRDGRRPCFGDVERMQTDPRWRDNLLFHEYFHAATGPTRRHRKSFNASSRERKPGERNDSAGTSRAAGRNAGPGRHELRRLFQRRAGHAVPLQR
jgi:hypothetical protein